MQAPGHQCIIRHRTSPMKENCNISFAANKSAKVGILLEQGS
jgi:hypothetical protein